jgi:hypothetical protein
MIAAGGGGDAIAAAIVAASRFAEPADILTYSWDRLLIDPLPGPRDPSSFEGLEKIGRYNCRVLPTTAPISPAGSTLPRLASELNARLWLIDPRGGALGLADQIHELAELLGTDVIEVIDVGGDILARKAEHTAHGALADTLVLAGVSSVQSDAGVMLAGLGLDGEPTPEHLLSRNRAVSTQNAFHIDRKGVGDFGRVFEWHPSEVTGLLWAATMGARGVAEIRSEGLRVTLEDDSTLIKTVRVHDIIKNNPLVDAVTGSRSLHEAEAALRLVGCPSEIDYERRRASKIRRPTLAKKLNPHNLVEHARSIAQNKASQGVDFLTLRRLFEMMRSTLTTYTELHELLRIAGAHEYRPPLWLINQLAWPEDHPR